MSWFASSSVSTKLSWLGLLLCALNATAAAQSAEALEHAVASLEFRSIGPAVMGGRIADLAVVESRPQTFYVGTASGGLWKTTNHGTSWEPLFDDQTTASIGDVTLAPSNPNVIWVGTGEPQNRQSSPWGNGVYKSVDGGRTFSHMGLTETHHVGRIVVHPRNPDVVYVAAVGHLWGPNPERGVYRSTDGGETWEKVLYVDENTGAIDLVMDPDDPNTLFAAMYQRMRTGYGFNGGGPGSGIYRTLDGGDSWHELTEGLPDGDMGRIGLDVYRRDGNLVYAIVEADKRDPTQGFGGAQSGARMSGVFRSRDRGETWERMSTTNPRPMYYSQIRIDPNNPERIYVLGTQLFVSDDGGKTFRNDAARNIHVDHHALWIDPSDSDHLLLGSDGGVSTSWDGAEHWRMIDNLPIGQFYQIGVDMRDPYYVCGGLQDNDSWCGPSRTLSIHGIRNSDWYEVWGGDGFYNLVDPTDHTIVFTESQGGNLGRYDVTTGEKTRLRPLPGPRSAGDEEREYRFNWNTPVVMSPHDPSTIFIGANVLLQSKDRGHAWEEISPDLTKQIDRTELEIMGVKGSEAMMSANDGISSYGNITTISESPVAAGLIYVGTDDGNVWVTRDGGANWIDLTSNVRDLPERTYVSRLVASRHAEGLVYATFDGHRNDDYRPYVYVSEDYGAHWRTITTGLPDAWSVNVIAEHPRSQRLLFLGNEVGVYFSIDRGASWVRLQNNLPTVPVDDIVVHPRDDDLVLGTHGRSIWILHDLAPLVELSDELLALEAHVFPVQPVKMWSLKGDWPFPGATYSAPNPPAGARIRYYLRDTLAAAPANADSAESRTGARDAASQGQRGKGAEPKARLTILDDAGTVIRTLDGPGTAGIHEVTWDLRHEPPYEAEGETGGFFAAVQGPRVLPGSYVVQLEVGGDQLSSGIRVEPEPRRPISDADRAARQRVLMDLYRLAGPVHDAEAALQEVRERLTEIRRLVEEQAEVPEAITTTVDSLDKDVSDLRNELRDASRGLRVASAIEASTTMPTEDQMWQVEKLWSDVPGQIRRLNAVIETRMPALERSLGEHGIRPSAGKPITVPER